jgi:uncharacterized protein
VDNERAQKIIEAVLQWAKAQPLILAVALVGSHARGTARPDSDIDLVVLTADPDFFRRTTEWIDAVDWNSRGVSPVGWLDEDFGQLWSRRIWLEPGHEELEIDFALPAWANVQPLDPGTRQVIADGCRVMHDPEGLLSRLCAAVRQGQDKLSCRSSRRGV